MNLDVIKEEPLLPIPSHLKDFLEINAKKSKQKKLHASLKCDCGYQKFMIKKSTYPCVVQAVCHRCQNEITVFDAREHG